MYTHTHTHTQLKIQSLMDKHGQDPDLWPIAKSLLTSPPPHPSLLTASHPPLQQGHHYKTHPESPSDESPRLELSWQFHSPAGTKRNPHYSGQTGFEPDTSVSTGQQSPTGDFKAHSQPPLTPSLSSTSSESSPNVQNLTTSQISRGKPARRGHRLRGFPTFQTEEQCSVGSWRQNRGSLASLRSREDPDGQSDISSNSPEHLLIPAERRSVSSIPPSAPLTPPPSTPLTTNGNSYKPTITPEMIQSALEALELMENKDTPISLTPHGTADESHGPIFPEAVTNALTAWISSQSTSGGQGVSSNATPLLSPPPSTPLETDSNQNTEDELGTATIRHGISASDLITALSTLMPSSSRHNSINTSGDSSIVCSVPACTPKEGLSEWIKLGIRPDEVIQALSALTIASNEDGETEPSERVKTVAEDSLKVAQNEGSLLVEGQTATVTASPPAEKFDDVKKQVLVDRSSPIEPVYPASSGYHDSSEDEESDSVFSTPPPPLDIHLLSCKTDTLELNVGMGHEECGTGMGQIGESTVVPHPPSLAVAIETSTDGRSHPDTCVPDESVPGFPGNDEGVHLTGEDEESIHRPVDSVLYSDLN